MNYEFSVFVNDVNVCNYEGVSEFRGYSTIPLDKQIQINKGDEFKVIFKNKCYALIDSRAPLQSNVSFISADGKNWRDLSKDNAMPILKFTYVMISIFNGIWLSITVMTLRLQ